MKKLLYFFLLFPTILSAQINESDTLNLKADLSITGFTQSGNVETLIFRANSNISFKPTKNLVFKTNNSYVYQEFGNQKADEDILSLNFLYLNPDRKLYPQLLGFVSTNYRREINLRYLLGAGVTYQLVNQKDTWLKVSISSEYEQTDFAKARFNRTKYNGDKSITTIRGTIWANGKYELFENKVVLNHEFYFQPSLQQSNNYRWQANIGLELPIWKYLNFKINYIRSFESIVIENQKQQDSMMTFGFTVKSY
jgi:putative salt-induced outer membrane protein YdiY